MEREMSFDVAIEIIGTLRIHTMIELNKETDPDKRAAIEKRFRMLTEEERIAQGLVRFEGWENVRVSVMDKIKRLYAPQLKAYYEKMCS